MWVLDKVAIGNNIRRWREQQNLSQNQLAEKLDIATETLCRVEKGKVMLSMYQLRALLELSGLDPNYFLYSPGDKENEIIQASLPRQTYERLSFVNLMFPDKPKDIK